MTITFLMFVAFHIYKWYMLVYRTPRCYVSINEMPIEAILYEEQFIKMFLFLISSILIVCSYYFIKKICRVR